MTTPDDDPTSDTAQPAPEILWKDGIPHATRFDDRYYSSDDPAGETRHTFVEGTGLSDLCQKPRLTIAETGFGTGLNFLEAAALWCDTAPATARLDYIAVEGFAMARPDLARAHAMFPQHATLSAQLRDAWPAPGLSGTHRLRLANGRIRLILLIDDVVTVLRRHDFTADAWFLDGFAPAKNPDMWQPSVMQQVARLSAAGTRLASFTAATAVRRSLQKVGFQVTKRPGFGKKRECLAATFAGPASPAHRIAPWTVPPPARSPARADNDRIAVIGDGIAAWAVMRALRDAGRDPIQIAGTVSSQGRASALPQALIAPNLVRGVDGYATFARQAYLDALRVLDGLPPDAGIWHGARGVILPAMDAAAEQQQARLLADLAWPDTELRHIPAAEASTLQGRPTPGGLFLPRAGSINPDALRRAFGIRPDLTCDVAGLRRQSDQWAILDTSDKAVCTAASVILACGAGTAALLPDGGKQFGLRTGVGQLINVDGAQKRHLSLLADGYVTATDSNGGFTAGASIDPWPDARVQPQVDADRTDALVQRLKPILPDETGPVSAWVGLRCDTTDHLPICGAVQDTKAFAEDFAGLRHGKHLASYPPARHLPGLYTLTGLGARGFQSAFLLADHLAALITGASQPLDRDTAQALSPCRYQIRHLRKPDTPPVSGSTGRSD